MSTTKSTKQKTLQIVALVLGLLLVGLLVYFIRSPGPPVTVEGPSREVSHGRGTSTIPTHPQKIVPFDLAALDILDALGVPVVGVAGSTFPTHLSRYGQASYRVIGTLFEPDYEALHAVAPDLVITGGRSTAKFKELAAIFPTIDLQIVPDRFLESVEGNTKLLASIFGKEEIAEQRLTALKSSIQELRTLVQDRGKGIVVLANGGRLSAYGPGSRFGLIHSEFGIPVAAEGLDVSLHGEAIHAEFLLEKNPSWIFVIDRDTAIGQTGSAEKLLDHSLVHRTEAWTKKQIVYLDPLNWYLVSGGLQSTQRMVDELRAAYAR